MNFFKKIITSKTGKLAAAGIGAGVLYMIGAIDETMLLNMVSTLGG